MHAAVMSNTSSTMMPAHPFTFEDPQGASFECKDALRARGYRWDADRKVWWTEVADDARTAEEFWLAANVYAASRNARSMAPRFEKITAAERFL